MADSQRIRPEELSKAISKAVEIAQAKHKVQLQAHPIQPDFARIPWWIAGRVLRDRIDLDQAHKLAETITLSVNGKSKAFQPVTARFGDDILVGFIERYGGNLELPQQILGGGPQG